MTHWTDGCRDIIHNASSLDEAREMAKAMLILAGSVDRPVSTALSYRADAAMISAAYDVMVADLAKLRRSAEH